MLRAQGYAVTSEPGRADVEEDTITCAHCNGIVFLTPGFILHDEQVRKCTTCDRFICPSCGGTDLVFNDETGKVERAACDPFEKKLERMEARDRFRRSLNG